MDIPTKFNPKLSGRRVITNKSESNEDEVTFSTEERIIKNLD